LRNFDTPIINIQQHCWLDSNGLVQIKEAGHQANAIKTTRKLYCLHTTGKFDVNHAYVGHVQLLFMTRRDINTT